MHTRKFVLGEYTVSFEDFIGQKQLIIENNDIEFDVEDEDSSYQFICRYEINNLQTDQALTTCFEQEEPNWEQIILVLTRDPQSQVNIAAKKLQEELDACKVSMQSSMQEMAPIIQPYQQNGFCFFKANNGARQTKWQIMYNVVTYLLLTSGFISSGAGMLLSTPFWRQHSDEEPFDEKTIALLVGGASLMLLAMLLLVGKSMQNLCPNQKANLAEVKPKSQELTSLLEVESEGEDLMEESSGYQPPRFGV